MRAMGYIFFVTIPRSTSNLVGPFFVNELDGWLKKLSLGASDPGGGGNPLFTIFHSIWIQYSYYELS
jgi:hypothetical protein